MLSAICFNLDQSKIWSSGNGLKLEIVCKSVKFVENQRMLKAFKPSSAKSALTIGVLTLYQTTRFRNVPN